MIKFKIKEIQKNNVYVLENDSTKEKETLMLEFYKLDNPDVDDLFYISEKLLDKKSRNFVQPYSFECPDNHNELHIKNNVDEYAILVAKGKKYILKRIYG